MAGILDWLESINIRSPDRIESPHGPGGAVASLLLPTSRTLGSH